MLGFWDTSRHTNARDTPEVKTPIFGKSKNNTKNYQKIRLHTLKSVEAPTVPSD